MECLCNRVLVGWGLFFASHLCFSTPAFREHLCRKYGKGTFFGLYAFTSTTTIGFTSYYYFLGHGRGPILHHFNSNIWITRFASLLKFTSLIVLGQAFVTPNPLSLLAQNGGGMYIYHPKSQSPHHSKSSSTNDHGHIEGILRITRYPSCLGLTLFGLGNMLKHNHKIDHLFWGALPLLSTLSCIYNDFIYKHQSRTDNTIRLWHETSFLPFGSILSGQQSFTNAWDEIGITSLRFTTFSTIIFVLATLRFRRGFWHPNHFSPL